MTVISYRQALHDTPRAELQRDENVLLIGEEIGVFEGSYKITAGLLAEFGPRRVRDTPICEEGFTGVAIGAAMMGLRPVVEIMTINFSLLAIDQIVNNAAKPARPLVAPPTSPSPFTAVAAQPAPVAVAPLAPAADAEEIPLSRVRRLTAQRLAASAREAPHFYLTVVADVGDLLAFRVQANRRHDANVKITVTDLLIRACATALAAHPEINVSWDETRILRHRHVSIGVAVAIDDGLIVPVIRDADRKTLTEIAREARDLTTRARARKLSPDELAGGTFTISNLGMYGIRQFTAVINPPQAAILAVGEAVRQPVVRDDQVIIATTMTLTLSIDHRAVDGATAAGFLTHLRELIEEPLDIVL